MSDVVAKLKKALEAIEYLPNGVYDWETAHGGNRTLSASNAKKVREAEDLLSSVLASIPGSLTYRAVGLPGIKGTYSSLEAFKRALAALGHREVGRNFGGRPELRGSPTFSGLVGPIYDGPGIVRYDTGEVADMLSR